MYKISIAAAALLFGAEALKTDRKFQKLVQVRARIQARQEQGEDVPEACQPETFQICDCLSNFVEEGDD